MTYPAPSVSVIIPARNAARYLPEQLASLAAQDFSEPFEVIVVDNGSTDTTRDAARRFADCLKLKIVAADDKVAPGYARNVGARRASGSLLCFCDADDRCAESWLSALVRAADGGTAVGGQIDEISLNTPRTQSWRSRLAPDGLANAWYFLDYASSCNFAIWRSAFERLGGFREDFISCEDVDLCWRLQLSGGLLCYAPDAVVAYRHRDSLAALARQNIIRGFWAVALVNAHQSAAVADGRRPRLATPWERMAYWDSIKPGRGGVGRWTGVVALEIGIHAGIVSSLKNCLLTSLDSTTR